MTKDSPTSSKRLSSGLLAHLEHHLGLAEAGWSTAAQGSRASFEVVRFAGRVGGGVPFVTVGLSDHPLPSRVSEKSIRHELLMLVPGPLHDGPVPGVMARVAQDTLAAGAALLRGEVLGPRGPLFGTAMEALYVAAPVYLDPEFGVYASPDGEVVIAWLVPITAAEARYVTERGWRPFEELLTAADPDLVDLTRRSLV